MLSFNKYLYSLRDFTIELEKTSDAKDIRGEIQEVQSNYEGADPLFDRLTQPLIPETTNLTIYYPISNGQFPPLGITYNTNRPITPADLFDSIAAFYKQKLTQENIDAYLATGKYNGLRDPIYTNPIFGGIKVRDVVSGDYLLRLDPYQDGHIVVLERV